MSEKSYQIVVTGELAAGGYLPEVKAKLAALFKMPAEKLDPLFSGRRVVIKKGLDMEATEKYVAAVRSAGLVCSAEEIAEEIGTEVPQAPSTQTKGISLAPAGTTLIDRPSVAMPQIDVSAYSMAPVGETLVEPPEITVADIDISALSMGVVGEVLVEHTPPQEPSIDISTLSIAPVGARLADQESVAPVAIDTGNLDLAPVGSDVGEIKREDGPTPPDTSHLKLD
jgi:hypothetical protein